MAQLAAMQVEASPEDSRRQGVRLTLPIRRLSATCHEFICDRIPVIPGVAVGALFLERVEKLR